MKALKIIGILLGALFALVLVLPFLVDLNEHKEEIVALVKEETGRDLVIAGDIDLSVFPWLGASIGEVELGNAPGFGETPFARMQGLEVRVKLLPLLRKEVDVSTVRLKGLELNLARDARGRTNWDDLLRPAPAAGAAPGAKEQAAPAGGPPALAALALGGVEIQDARLAWDDRQAGQRYEIEDLDLSLGAIRPGEPVDFRLHTRLTGGDPAMEGELDMRGRLSLSQDLERFDIEALELDAAASGGALPTKIEASLGADLALDLAGGTLEVPRLELAALGVEARGQVQGSGIGGDAPAFKGRLSIEPFAPRKLLGTLGVAAPETADLGVLGKAQADLAFEAGTRAARIGSLSLTLDDSRLSGTASVEDFATPAVRFDLALDAIDLDRYLPPPKEGEAPVAATPAEAAAGAAGTLPVETLRALNVAGKLKVGSLKVSGLKIRDILLAVTAKDGLLQVKPASAALYGGSYRGGAVLDVRGKAPRVALDERLEAVQVGPLLKDLMGEDRLLGTASIRARVHARGQDPDAMRRTLNGQVAFNFANGAVEGINVAHLIRTAKARIEGRPPPEQKGPNQTDFTELRGTLKLVDGVAHNDDLTAKSPLLRVAGKGKADLVQERLDYLLTTKIVASLEGQGGADLADLRGLPIPVRISGPFQAPKYRVELDKVLAEAAKKKVKEQVGKELEKALSDEKSPLKDLGNQLKGIFGR